MNRKPGPCNAGDCENPFTRLYPCGWRCAGHAPGSAPGEQTTTERTEP